VKLQAPLAFAVAVPICKPPSNTLTALSASAVPANVRRFALVIPSPTVPLSGENDVILVPLGPACPPACSTQTAPSGWHSTAARS
jgi:hypothetical protein